MDPDYTIFSGDTRILNIAICDEAGKPVDVSDAKAIVYAIGRRVTDAKTITKSLQDGIAVKENLVTVRLEPDDTDKLVDGTYIHEMQIITASGDVYTVLRGNIEAVKDFIE